MNIQHSIKIESYPCYFLVRALEELKEKFPDVYNSFIPVKQKEFIALPVPNKIGWEVLVKDITIFNITKLELLYILLRTFKYISEGITSYETFASHFINTEYPSDKRIIWLGKNYVLPLLFLKLMLHGIIPEVEVSNMIEMLYAHFEYEAGKRLNISSLENQVSKASSLEEKNINKIIGFLTCQK